MCAELRVPAWDWGGGFLLGVEGWSEEGGSLGKGEGREMEKKEQGRKKRQEISAPWLSPRLPSRRQTAAFPFGSESPSGKRVINQN